MKAEIDQLREQMNMMEELKERIQTVFVLGFIF
jgi:23S rRNA maturation-related 3'-5' exoribonuclease YhaM